MFFQVKLASYFNVGNNAKIAEKRKIKSTKYS